MPKLRAKAVGMVVMGYGVREVARYFGYRPGTISKWVHKVPKGGAREIPTGTSRPKHHPKETKNEIVRRIVEVRKLTDGRCAEVVHQMLANEGTKVSLSTVKRVLDRQGLTKKKSPWKRKWKPIERPYVTGEGELVEMDTIHLYEGTKLKVYIYTLLDVHSRWAYAEASERINTHRTLDFVRRARRKAPFSVQCFQTDHGSEFSQNFTERVRVVHRHTRVRKPNDNAHVERFNRTIQEECLSKLPFSVEIINKNLPSYLKYYNEKRLHLGLNLKTPLQSLKCFQAID
jgi:transposase InsO family protein